MALYAKAGGTPWRLHRTTDTDGAYVGLHTRLGTVLPAYVQAKILGTRTAATYLDHLAAIDPADVPALAEALGY